MVKYGQFILNSLVVDILPSKESKVVGTLRVPLYFGLGGNLQEWGIFKKGTRSVPTTLEPRCGVVVGY